MSILNDPDAVERFEDEARESFPDASENVIAIAGSQLLLATVLREVLERLDKVEQRGHWSI